MKEVAGSSEPQAEPEAEDPEKVYGKSREEEPRDKVTTTKKKFRHQIPILTMPEIDDTLSKLLGTMVSVSFQTMLQASPRLLKGLRQLLTRRRVEIDDNPELPEEEREEEAPQEVANLQRSHGDLEDLEKAFADIRLSLPDRKGGEVMRPPPRTKLSFHALPVGKLKIQIGTHHTDALVDGGAEITLIRRDFPTISGCMVNKEVTGSIRGAGREIPFAGYVTKCAGFKREVLAILHCLKTFQAYLFGRRFVLRIDPTNVAGALKNYRPIDPTVGRWVGFIWQFDYKIERIAGIRNKADGLSQFCITPEGVEDAGPINAFLEFEGGTLAVDNEMMGKRCASGELLIRTLEKGALAVVAELREAPVTTRGRKNEKDSWGVIVGPKEELIAMGIEGGRDTMMSLVESWKRKELRWTVNQMQERKDEDQEGRRVFNAQIYEGIFREIGLLLVGNKQPMEVRIKAREEAERYVLMGGHLFKREEGAMPRRVVCGRSRQLDVIQAMHDGLVGGHRSSKGTLAKITSLYYWPGMAGMVATYCHTCLICQEQSSTRVFEPLRPTRALGPRYLVHINLAAMPVSTDGYRYILDARDNLSGFVEAVALKKKTGRSVADRIEDFYLRHPFIKRFVADNGTEFENQEVLGMLKRLCVPIKLTEPYHPEVNAPVERGYRTLKNTIAKLAADHLGSWPRGKKKVKSGEDDDDDDDDEGYGSHGREWSGIAYVGCRYVDVRGSVWWWYIGGIPFERARMAEYRALSQHMQNMLRGMKPALPQFMRIAGTGIQEQRLHIADKLRDIRGQMEHTGATILTNGRKSLNSEPIVNFLAAGQSDAILYTTVRREGVDAETAYVVLRRWKVFEDFGVKKINVICTDSASVYVAAGRVLRNDPDPDIRRIPWLPCFVHCCNLMLSDMGHRVADEGEGGCALHQVARLDSHLVQDLQCQGRSQCTGRACGWQLRQRRGGTRQRTTGPEVVVPLPNAIRIYVYHDGVLARPQCSTRDSDLGGGLSTTSMGEEAPCTGWLGAHAGAIWVVLGGDG
ncbi:hypothetical protein CBR_g4266 [Chara braunii]|uniref:Integrase catalytic domain-containing protein n=1 Tax=Chara braunii TaxID=69332 RepID=A0A388JR96_CHABU|nr:hypothetical protein CBR_g4266 [Chara braunii]|eukprot:GBG60311.1 hypothetical protein CBR_g4266 [Chara braunii]